MKTKITAILMICLIIFLPISSFALQITERHGADGIEGFIKRVDTITVKVIATGATPETLKYFTNYEYGKLFSSCEGNVCTFTGAQIDYTGYVGPSITANIGLYNGQNILLEQTSTVLGFDDQKPEISISAPSKIGGQNISVNYNARDKTTGTSSCSGVSKIQFFIGDSMIQEFDITPSCSASGTLSLASSNFQEGNIELKVKAIDRMQLESDFATLNAEVDLTPPTVDATTFKILKDNAIIEYSNGEEINVIAQIQGQDLKEASGNLNGLNINGGYSNIRATCSAGLCSWNIKLKIKDTVGSVAIKAVDTAGNQIENTFTPNLAYDTTAPQVIKLRSAVMAGDKSILNNYNNTIVAEISENGKIDPNQIFLDLSPLGLGKKHADSCIAGWSCYWYNIPATGSGSKTLTLLSESTDNAGNHFNSYSSQFFIDAKNPIINSIVIRNIGSVVPAFEGFVKTWDSLSIDMFITEENQIDSAVLDASKFITDGSNIIATSCEDTGLNVWKCQWNTAPIDITGHITGNLKFTITDKAGNSIQALEPLEVFDVSNATQPNYWSNSIECSPDKIDREVTRLLNQRVYCHVSLTGNAEIMQVGLGECTGEEIESGNSRDFIQNIEIMNEKSQDPYLKVTLVATDMKLDNLPLKCQLLINSKFGDKINTIPEVEEVNFVIKFYNLPLGELSSSVQDKIDKSKDAGKKGIFGIIGKIQKLLSYVDKFCTLYYSIIEIVQAFQTIGKLMAIISDGAQATGYGVIWEKISKGYLLGEESFEIQMNEKAWGKFFNKMCKWSSCRLGTEDKLTEKAVAEKEEVKKEETKKKGGIRSVFSRLGGLFRSKKGSPERAQKKTERLSYFARLGPAEKVADYLDIRDPAIYMNPKDSLILSIAMPCIPGIIYNLDKYRQIKCLYATCLEENAKANLPLQACDDQKAYSTCKYVVGEIFNLIGIVAIFDYIFGIFKNALMDPLGAVDVIFGNVCHPKIVQQKKVPAAICLIESIISQIGDAIADFQTISDGINNWKKPVDYCD